MTDDEAWTLRVAGATLPAKPKPKKRKTVIGIKPGYPNFYDPITRRWYERKKL